MHTNKTCLSFMYVSGYKISSALFHKFSDDSHSSDVHVDVIPTGVLIIKEVKVIMHKHKRKLYISQASEGCAMRSK